MPSSFPSVCVASAAPFCASMTCFCFCFCFSYAASGCHMSSPSPNPPTGWPTSHAPSTLLPPLSTTRRAHRISHTTFAALNLTQKARALAASKKKKKKEKLGRGRRENEWANINEQQSRQQQQGLSLDPPPSKVVVWHPQPQAHFLTHHAPSSGVRHHPPATTHHSPLTTHQAPRPPTAGKQAWPATQQSDFDAQKLHFEKMVKIGENYEKLSNWLSNLA